MVRVAEKVVAVRVVAMVEGVMVAAMEVEAKEAG